MDDQIGLRHILDEDPDLGESIEGARRVIARRRAVASVVRLETGPADLARPFGQTAGWLGLLVLDGLILRHMRVLGRATTQVLGAGDVLCPWEGREEWLLLPSESSLEVVMPARIALLDDRFAERVRPWPEIAAALIGRVERRAESLALARTVGTYPRVDVRIVALLWDLAQRFGRVVEDETVVLPLPLTHRVLARIVGCERQSVTSALGALRRDGLVERSDRGFMLHGTLPLQVAFLLSRGARERRPGRFTVVPGGARGATRAAG
ncbi:MAG TPA: Crp/Fnr family transcriptional regulator [Thermoleophilaceae bacterium]|nr:Crp/Fnr family transcriptional regulator [Thermoleophilaceae bacterium]